MKTFTKLKTFLIIFFIAIFVVIIGRYFIGLHFKKKFSVRPDPGVITTIIEKSMFYKSIETFGTAIAENSKTYRVTKDNIVGNLNIKKGRTLKKKEELIKIFKERQILIDQEMAFTCGSGVTACILGLANSIISGKKPIIYDGSWAEYGLE